MSDIAYVAKSQLAVPSFPGYGFFGSKPQNWQRSGAKFAPKSNVKSWPSNLHLRTQFPRRLNGRTSAPPTSGPGGPPQPPYPPFVFRPRGGPGAPPLPPPSFPRFAVPPASSLPSPSTMFLNSPPAPSSDSWESLWSVPRPSPSGLFSSPSLSVPRSRLSFRGSFSSSPPAPAPLALTAPSPAVAQFEDNQEAISAVRSEINDEAAIIPGDRGQQTEGVQGHRGIPVVRSNPPLFRTPTTSSPVYPRLERMNLLPPASVRAAPPRIPLLRQSPPAIAPRITLTDMTDQFPGFDDPLTARLGPPVRRSSRSFRTPAGPGRQTSSRNYVERQRMIETRIPEDFSFDTDRRSLRREFTEAARSRARSASPAPPPPAPVPAFVPAPPAAAFVPALPPPPRYPGRERRQYEIENVQKRGGPIRTKRRGGGFFENIQQRMDRLDSGMKNFGDQVKTASQMTVKGLKDYSALYKAAKALTGGKRYGRMRRGCGNWSPDY